MLEGYEAANLVPLLETIRKPGRYAGLYGVNALTNAAPVGSYDRAEVCRELRRAVDAGKRKDHAFVPSFTHQMQGFAYGLNPYTDWALARLKATPTHYYLFLGLDWYSISALGHTEDWFDYLRNPFEGSREPYWHNVWAWILRRVHSNSWQTRITEQDAAGFIRADGGGFIFHNRIPYLRPAGCESSGVQKGTRPWYETEWCKPSVRQDVIDDLRVLRSLAGSRIVAFCTSQESVEALHQAGYDRVFSWKAHPSKVFYPKMFEKESNWFRGRDYFR
jgi:hypothetical protein